LFFAKKLATYVVPEVIAVWDEIAYLADPLVSSVSLLPVRVPAGEITAAAVAVRFVLLHAALSNCSEYASKLYVALRSTPALSK
jgi:ABC-type nitrate/sulfonate/bicarbonate transport system permease component